MMETSSSNGAQNGEALLDIAKCCHIRTEHWHKSAICSPPVERSKDVASSYKIQDGFFLIFFQIGTLRVERGNMKHRVI